VALTGAFLTGQPLQVRLADYSRIQRQVCEELNRSSNGWDHDGLRWRDVESYGSGGGYTSLVPLVLIRRTGTALSTQLEQLLGECPAPERAWLEEATAGWSWTLTSLQIELYDLGVGVITGVYEITAPARLSAAATLRTVEAVSRLRLASEGGIRSPVAASYEALSRETVRLFADAIAKSAAETRQDAWLTPMLTALSPADGDAAADESGESSGEWGRLLWLHPVFVLTGSKRSSGRSLRRLSRPFEAAFSQQIEYWHGVFTPGIDSSVLALRGDGAPQNRLPMRLTGLMWAYYALFMEIDRGLLAMVDDDKWQNPNSLGALEADAQMMFTIYTRVQEARARLDSALTDLAGGQLSIWNAMSDVQRFDELVAAVEQKVEMLQRMAERRLQEATAARARTTGNVLSALTALTVVSLAAALLEIFVGTPAEVTTDLWVRIAVIVVAFALAVTLVATILLRRRRRPPSPRRRQAPSHALES